jgi:hypothetical protein
MRALIACWLVLLGLSGQAAAQAPRLTLERVGLDKAPQVKVYGSLLAPDGSSLVHGKKGGDFKLIVDKQDQGRPAALTIFERASEPVYVVAVVQLSPAMQPAMDEVRKGLRLVADAVSRIPESRMSLISYTDSVQRLVESGSASELGAALGKLKVDPEGAAEAKMLEALRISVDMLRGQEKGRRRLVLIFSDGTDENNDKKLFGELGEKAANDGIQIHSVGFAPFEPGRLRSLIDLAKATKGIARGCKAPAEISQRYAQTAVELLRQYVGLWDLKVKGDGKIHTLQLVVEHEGKEIASEEMKQLLPEGVGGTARALGGCGCRIGGR